MYYIVREDELYHHGVKGMKWGVRKQPQSIGGRLHRLAAANYGLNERTYRRLGNNTMAGMNARARQQSLAKAEAANARKQQRLSDPAVQARRKKIKRAAAVGGVVAGAVLVSYGAYKIAQVNKSSKSFTIEELKAMGIHTFEPARFEIPRKTIERTSVERTSV